MRWVELGIATVAATLFVAFELFPGQWCRPLGVRLTAGLFVALVAVGYLYFVDDERRPTTTVLHRIGVGTAAGLLVGVIADLSSEADIALVLLGGISAFVGFRWLKHVQL